MFGGGVSSERLAVQRGIRQGCPSSGTLWSILYDPFVRSLLSALPPRRGRLGVFADDLGAALRHCVRDFPPLLVFLRDNARASGLALHIEKTKLV